MAVRPRGNVHFLAAADPEGPKACPRPPALLPCSRPTTPWMARSGRDREQRRRASEGTRLRVLHGLVLC